MTIATRPTVEGLLQSINASCRYSFPRNAHRLISIKPHHVLRPCSSTCQEMMRCVTGCRNCVLCHSPCLVLLAQHRPDNLCPSALDIAIEQSSTTIAVNVKRFSKSPACKHEYDFHPNARTTAPGKEERNSSTFDRQSCHLPRPLQTPRAFTTSIPSIVSKSAQDCRERVRVERFIAQPAFSDNYAFTLKNTSYLQLLRKAFKTPYTTTQGRRKWQKGTYHSRLRLRICKTFPHFHDSLYTSPNPPIYQSTATPPFPF